ncbi:MAG: cyclic nucleotide-binding domain-containing protein [Acidobacteriia bacterium]|nr:cyclic nucleotide-binding domain-containing protein [Terriglobia bacterium]
MAEPAVARSNASQAPQSQPAGEGGTVRRTQDLAGDFWGGLAAMLVALPSAIAFGVTILAPLGSSYAAQGAIAGILGTFALGMVAPTFGGTRRLITAPCAPATAVMSALAIVLTQRGVGPEPALLMLAVVALLCGVMEIAFGVIGLGKLIKYMPYPVVSGYLSGVGLVIILSQVPKYLGTPKSLGFWEAVGSPGHWKWEGMIVGAVTVAVMVLAPKVTKAVPAAILGLLAGMGAYFALGLADKSMLALAGNKLVIGPLAGSNVGFVEAIVGRWKAVSALHGLDMNLLFSTALTLAVLLSIDTLKTSVVLDALTRSRHNSNKELIGQGLGNLASVAIGGVPGSGQMGATLVNMSSGGQTRRSGVIEGALALLAFLILGRLIAWVPIAALAGILIVVGVRMFDRNSLHLLKSRSTILDFGVIATVVVVAETVSLIAASGVGIGLAIMLFIRQQVGGAVVRRKVNGNERFSKQMRLPQEMAILEKRGDRTVIFELQGSLFFGTTDQLYTELEPELKKRTYVVLDMRRVQSVDFTAAHMLEQIEDMLADRGGVLIFSHMPNEVPSGQDMERYFDTVGLVRAERHAKIFAHLDEALEWIEDRILEEERMEREQEKLLDLREIELFRQRKEETLAAFESCTVNKSYKAGEKIFSMGDAGDELFLIRRGTVRILMPLGAKSGHHLATFGRGDFFGEMSFLDRAPRSADAVSHTDTELYVITRKRFDELTVDHRMLALNMMEGIATALASRLRRTDVELRSYQEN